MKRGRKTGGAEALASTLIVLAALVATFAPYVVSSNALSPPSSNPNRGGIPPSLLPGGSASPSAAGAKSGLETTAGLSAATFGARGSSGPPAGIDSPPSGIHFDYLVIIVMENHGICDILTTCGGTAPYMTGLANASGLATHYVDVNDPSLPNYLALSGGTDFGCGGYDGNPNSNNCTALAWAAPNIVDRLEAAGVTWKTYQEDMPSNCFGGNSGNYVVRHNPFMYYSGNVNNPSRCARIIPSGPNASALLNDLRSTANASNYMWFTPNKCNDMHSCSVATGDVYLAHLVPKILTSTVFTTQRAALAVLFDEDAATSKPYLYTVWSGPAAKAGYNSSTAYNHYSFLATIESNWNLSALTANDLNAAPMAEFFGRPTARFTYTPTWPKVNGTVDFDATPSTSGSNATLRYRWDWTNDGVWDTPWSPSPGAQHAYDTAGLYVASLEVNDTRGSVANTTQSVPVDGAAPVTDASLAGTFGLNGWYTGNVTVRLTATDDRSGVAETNVSVNGTASQPYGGPFVLHADGNYTLAYYSTDNATNREATKNLSFRKDGRPPRTIPQFAGVVIGNAFVTPINVSLDATDPMSGVAGTAYDMDGGPWTNYAGTFSVDNVGLHVVRFYSTDGAGNVEPTNSFTADNGTVTGVVGFRSTATFQGTPGSGTWYTSSVNVTLEVINGTGLPESIWFRLDGGAWTLYSQPFAVTAEGGHTLDFNATNGAGLNEATHHAVFGIDRVPPTTTATLQGTIGNGGWYTSAVTVTLNATDASSGVAGIAYSLDNGSWLAYSTPFILGEGRHVLRYDATDAAGLTESIHSTDVSVDATPPATTASFSGTPGSNGWYTSNVTVSMGATDATSGVTDISIRVDNGSWAVYSGAFILSDGRHFVEYYATDLAGNVEPTHSNAVSVDTKSAATTVAFSGTHGNGGWYKSDVTVYLNATDAMSGVADIRYSLDNGSWQIYAGPLVLGEGRRHLEYRSTDVAGNLERLHVRDLMIDTTSPATTAAVSGTAGNNGWYVSNATATLAATDGTSGPASLLVRIDNGSWALYTGPITLGEGRHLLDFYATDVAGNAEPARSQSVTVDTTPPSTTAAFAGTEGENGWYTSNVTVSLTASDSTSGVAGISYRVDNGTWQAYGGPFTLSDGRHFIEYYATDLAGNAESAHSSTVAVDTTPPVATITLTGNLRGTGWYVSNVTVSLTASDHEGGVANITYRVDSGAWLAYSGPFVLMEGRHVIEYYATDVAGNSEPAQSKTVTIDTTSPATTATFAGTSGENGWYTSNVTVSLTASDATSGVAGISYRVNNGSWQVYGGPFTLLDGRHFLEYYATDAAGNVESVHFSTVAVDTTPPVTVMTLTGNLSGTGWYMSNVTVSLAAVDLEGVANITYRVDSGAWLVYSVPFVLTEGRHVIEYFATDIAGNSEPAQSKTVPVDTTSPATTAAFAGTSGENGWYTSNVTISFTTSDSISGVAGISYRVDNGSWQAYGSPFALSDGRHFVEWYAVDLAGNVESVHSSTVAVDTTPPITAIVLDGTLSDTGWYTSNVTVSLIASDPEGEVANITYRVDNGTWLAYSGPFVLTDGHHVIEFYATDVAGLVDAPQSRAIKINTIAPVTSLASSGSAGTNGWYVSTVSLILSASDGTGGVANISYRLDGGPWAIYSGPIVLGDGRHVLEYFATDNAGNVEATHSRDILVDTTPPQSSATLSGTLGSNSWYVSNVSVVLGGSDAMSGLDVVSYRLDNGAWTIYSGSFVLGEGSHVLEYYATDLAGLSSSIQSIGLAIDTTAPVTNAVLGGTLGNNGWYTSNVTIALDAIDTASGAATILYRINNGPWLTYTVPFTLTEGQHVVDYYATDLAGLVESSRSRTVAVDTTAPVTTDTVSGTLGNHGWYVSDVSVSLGAMDGTSGVLSIEYRLDGGAWVAYGGPVLISVGGRHVLEFASVDSAGNREATRSVLVAVEQEAPYFTSLSGPSSSTLSPVRITWGAFDNVSGIESYSVSVDGGPFNSVGTATSLSLDLAAGTHVVRVKATDAAGLSTVRSLSFSVVSPVAPFPLGTVLVGLGVSGGLAALAGVLWRIRHRRRPKRSEQYSEFLL